jgi:hypothetical protein
MLGQKLLTDRDGPGIIASGPGLGLDAGQMTIAGPA